MKTLTEQWHEFKAKCYPNGTLSEQELWRAFLAGSLVTFNLMMQAAELPEHQAEQTVKDLDREIREGIALLLRFISKPSVVNDRPPPRRCSRTTRHPAR